jgi:hypothetical protein
MLIIKLYEFLIIKLYELVTIKLSEWSHVMNSIINTLTVETKMFTYWLLVVASVLFLVIGSLFDLFYSNVFGCYCLRWFIACRSSTSCMANASCRLFISELRVLQVAFSLLVLGTNKDVRRIELISQHFVQNQMIALKSCQFTVNLIRGDQNLWDRLVNLSTCVCCSSDHLWNFSDIIVWMDRYRWLVIEPKEIKSFNN